jgi:LPS export ABC transporter permease LptF/LPS export ABC transporter permease LptG
MFKLIDRYLIRSFITPFAISLLIFTFILIVPFLVEQAEQLIAKGVAASVIVRVMVTLLPQALAVTIPMALLVALLIGLNRFSSDREWVALQACGVSSYRVLRPILLVAVAGWAATSWIIIWAVPSANQTFREITYSIVAQRAEGEVKPRVFFEDFPNKVLYVRDVPPDGQGWLDVFLADSTRPDNPTIYLAQRGRMLLDREKRTVELVLEDGTQHQAKADAPQDYNVFRFQQLVLSLDPETVFPRSGPAKGDREMTIAELKQQIVRLKAERISTHNAEMEIQKKFSIPIANFVFGLLALIFGLTTRRDGKLASFVFGIGVIFAYYVLMWTSQSAAKGGQVPAWLAMWVPNIVLGGFGIVLLVSRGPQSARWNAILSAAGRLRGRLAASSLVARLGRWSAAVRRRNAPVTRTSPVYSRWIPRTSILDGYITRLYLRVASLAFVSLLGIFYISTFIDLSDKLFKGIATLDMLLRYMWYATPQYVYYCIPLSVLIGGLVTIGLLTRNSELVVMRACGISLYRTALPLVLLAMAASAVLFTFEENVLAYSNRRAEALRHVIRGGSPRTFDVLNRRWIVGRDGEIYNYVYFEPRKSELNGFSVFRFAPKSWRLQSRSFFRQASFGGTATGQEDKVPWLARDGWTREFDRRSDSRGFQVLPSATIAVEPPQYFATEQPDANRMTYGQLRYFIADLAASGFNVVPYQVELHRKVSFPWVTVIMTLIAVPSAVSTGRKGAMYGIGLGVILAIVYWMASSVFAAIGSGGVIAPFLAAWAPNLLFGAAAAYLLLTVRT